MSKIEQVDQILSSILILENKTNPVLPLLLSSKNISNLIIYLNDQNKSLEEKLELLSTLLGYFQYNEYLINVFMRPACARASPSRATARTPASTCA